MKLDAFWIVSYNLALRKKFACYMKVEPWTSRSCTMNYLFKHVWKDGNEDAD